MDTAPVAAVDTVPPPYVATPVASRGMGIGILPILLGLAAVAAAFLLLDEDDDDEIRLPISP
jgi:hypothetical protein